MPFTWPNIVVTRTVWMETPLALQKAIAHLWPCPQNRCAIHGITLHRIIAKSIVIRKCLITVLTAIAAIAIWSY